ncbi:unnamed protein product [Periconia digitata]|uniref:Zn(2)-C6 fungal-type domain-containing protein n=1 Tax=Periconia digitata TaxID=1303443 RepID=A0A9W4UIZ0_9PLEO|nr:unnamed protein product [Periconia digitata]
MPKQRQTCTRCSMRRQKCDRKSPCTRCVQNKEAHLCTTEWSSGYNPAIHRKYPRKALLNGTREAGIKPQAYSSTTSLPNDVHSPMTMPFRMSGNLEQPLRDPSYISAANSTTSTDSTSGLTAAPLESEVLATYGRSEFADISVASLLSAKEEYEFQLSLREHAQNVGTANSSSKEKRSHSFSPAAQSVEVHHLQSLLPPKEQVLQMIDYHSRCMAYWVGSVYDEPSFRESVLEAYNGTEQISLCKHDWLWSALLFSILSASMIGSSEEISKSWGYSNAEKMRLSRTWGHSLISCLHLGDFASKYHIYSVQAIFNMHTSEHLVGSTKEWAVYQATGLVIARGLGMHRLGPHPEDDIAPADMTTKQKEALKQREYGRRIWCGLASQDWLCSTSQGNYNVQRRHYTSILPRPFEKETWAPVKDDNSPVDTMVTVFLHQVAYELSHYLDEMLDAPDISAKYNVVLKYDAIIRSIHLDKMPKFLRRSTPYDPAWDKWPWVFWARRSYEASAAHKVIMVHQSFLGKSFKDSRYTYSRWACLSSSKAIVDAMETRYPEEPQWWIEQAFVVTAGLVLGLDLIHHRSSSGGATSVEARETRSYMDRAIATLETWPTSSVASHGVRLLTSFIDEHAKPPTAKPSETHVSSEEALNTTCAQPVVSVVEEASRNIDPQASLPVPEMPEQQSSSAEDDCFVNANWAGIEWDVDMIDFEALVDPGLNGHVFFEGMLGVAGDDGVGASNLSFF